MVSSCDQLYWDKNNAQGKHNCVELNQSQNNTEQIGKNKQTKALSLF